MSIVAIVNNHFYADRKILLASPITPAYFAYGVKLIVNKDKTWAFMKCGNLPQLSVVDEIMEKCLLIISLHNDDSKIMVVEAAKRSLMKTVSPLVGFPSDVFAFAIKGKAFLVSKLTTTNCDIQEIPITSNLWVVGSGMHEFLADYLLGYPMDEIFKRVSATVESVSEEFDCIDYMNDLNPIITPLSSI